jgi:hypothetical protein
MCWFESILKKVAPVLESIFIIRTCIFENKCHFYALEIIEQIIPTKKCEDCRTSIFASGQGRYAMLTVPSSF